MTSQAPCRCVDNILNTYDENMAKADIPTQSLNNIMRHKQNTTAAHKNRIFFFLGGGGGGGI